MIDRRASLIGIGALAVLYGCSPVSLLNRLAVGNAGQTFTLVGDVPYGDDPRMRLDLYLPMGEGQNAPVVVFFYGGSWSSGSRDEYRFVGEALASRGILAVIADYRLYPEVRYPEFLKDCASALAWTFGAAARYGGDPERIFVAGHSAGAYNAAMLALDDRWLGVHELSPSRLKGWVGLAGPYNFLPIKDEAIKPIFFAPDTPVDSQPISHVNAHAPAALLMVARQDRKVYPERNTEVLAGLLREKGNSVVVLSYPLVSHTTLIGALAKPLRGLAPVLDDLCAFVRPAESA
ncbi:MAG: alpha/beta hydrolase [Burkholderiaceae bacterium]